MFEEGKIYTRKQLHDKYGGQRFQGISHCKNFDFIMIFSSTTGELYGYEDGWNKDGLYEYTGEGQYRDMVFSSGNKLLRDHKKNSEEVYLFEDCGSGTCRFVCELKLLDYYNFTITNSNKEIQEGIKFKFRRV